MAKTFRRLLSAVLAVVMCFGIALPAFAEEPATTAVSPTINKTNDGLDANDRTNVTLSVPGESDVLGSDIIYIVGSYASNKDGSPNVEGDVLISSLVTTMEEMVAKGTHVNFGMVPFSSDNVVAMPLTKIDESNIAELPAMIAKALATCEALYDGVNMENALIKSKKMFSESELKDHPERQHLVMISSGFTYFFNSGDNNEYVSTVPVNYTGVDRLFYWNKAWQRARLNQTNTYPIPKGIVNAYNKTEKTVSLWDFYWSYIDTWAKADIAAGDKVVFEACTIESANFLKWYNSGELVSGYSQTGYGKAIPAKEVLDSISNYVTLTAGANPLAKDANGEYTASAIAAQHAIGYERAMWEAYEYAKANIMDVGINFYPIYNALDVNYTNGNPSPASYGVTWTDQYIGHSFVNMLAGGEAVKYDKKGDKTFFEPIKDKIMYYCAEGSRVEDYIGYDAIKGNFEFIQNPAFISMAVGGVKYTTTKVETKEGYDFSVAFTAPGADEPTFWLDYVYGNGKAPVYNEEGELVEEGEKFVWTFGEKVSRVNPASVTYKLQLIDKAEDAGEYIIDTNLSAILYPKDSKGKELEPEVFPVPDVKYEVNPYDVDIVLALGAGIAQYDADSAKGTNTYDSIVKLVEELVLKGINVKLGLVAVEHYDDVAMPLTVLTKDNYKQVITDGLNAIQAMPAGPTNLHSNIVAAKEMLDADTAVPAANKFFHVIATGRTYNYDNEKGIPTTIINKVALKGSTYYYWGHYLWQSQRGGHTSLYMIPARYNNDWNAYWEDVCKWVEADGNKYAYSFTSAYDTTNPQWFNTFYSANNKDAKALGLASSRFGWILPDLTNSGLDAIGSGSNPANALNYERAQYEAWKAYTAMQKAGYNCYALCSESTSYQNESPYIKIAKYTGTSTMQLGHSFMNFLAGGEAKLLFVMTDPNTGASEMAKEFFAPIDVTKLVKTEKVTTKVPMMSTGPKAPKLEITTQPQDAYAAIGEYVTISVAAQGEDLKYQWYYRDAGKTSFTKSSLTTNEYTIILKQSRLGREVYCVITDAKGNQVTTDVATFYGCPDTELQITKQPVDAYAAIDENVTIEVKAQGEGLKYQWYYRDAGKTSFTKSSLTTNEYTIILKQSRLGREVYCVITDAYGNKVTSNVATFNGKPNVELQINQQPQDAYAALDEYVTISVDAQGEGLKYQWYYRDANKTSFTKSSLTTNEYSINLKQSRFGREVYCVITDAYGNKVTTDVATFYGKANVELQINQQPTDAAAAVGANVTVTVDAQGEGLKYQWYYRDAGKTSFTKSSLTTNEYSVILKQSRVGREVYCVITDIYGNSVTTDVATLLKAK